MIPNSTFGRTTLHRSKNCAQCDSPFTAEEKGAANFAKQKFCSQRCMGLSYRNGPEDFWLKVNKTEGCWLYTGQKLNSGYGEHGRKPRYLAHRFSWQLANGPIPKGLLCLHKCDTPLCVRPDHLFLGSDKDNRRDMHRKGRGYTKLKPEQVREIRAAYQAHRRGDRLAEKLAEQYGVNVRQIWNITSGRQWSEIQ